MKDKVTLAVLIYEIVLGQKRQSFNVEDNQNARNGNNGLKISPSNFYAVKRFRISAGFSRKGEKFGLESGLTLDWLVRLLRHDWP